MFCRSARRELVGYCKGVLSPRAKERLERHLSRCPRCRKECEEVRETLGLYHAADRMEPSAGFEAALAARIKPIREAAEQEAREKALRARRLRPVKLAAAWTARRS